MGDVKRFGCEVDEKVLDKFIEKVNKNYYKGKIRKVIEDFMKKYIE